MSQRGSSRSLTRSETAFACTSGRPASSSIKGASSLRGEPGPGSGPPVEVLARYEDWLTLSRLEAERGKAQGRPRVKLTSVEEVLRALKRGPG